MRIAQVCPRYYPNIGGVETHVREISERLVKKDFTVDVITTDPTGKLPKEEEINGVTVKRFLSFAPNEAYYLAPQIYHCFKRNDYYDIIHTHSYHAFPALFASFAAKGKRLIFTPHYHGTGHTFFRKLLHRPYRLIGSKIFNCSNNIICVSEYEKKIIIARFEVNRDKIIVIPNGINIERIRTSKPFSSNEKTVLYVGRLEKYKNVHYLIRIMKYLPDFKLKIIGNGSYKGYLKRLVGKLDLENRVTISTGLSNDDVYRWMKTCSIFVTLSDFEAFGITVIEALAAGKNVIVNDKRGLSELAQKFRGSVFGVDASEISITELAKLIHQKSGSFISVDLDEYCWENIVNRVASVYYNEI